ncbi:MAG: tetratricopeptide repeat protein, partial [Candidatus Omnitrophica bacterium]|nr:tetratricopeptide repeat protein [Candidatus Omnitrophota bacterium]
LYIPLVGILIAVFSVLEHIYRQRGFRAGFFMFSLIVIVFSFLTIWHNTFWKNEIVLFERVVEFEDDFGRGYNLLAKAYYQAGEYEKAVVADRKALDIMKGYLEKSKGTAAEGFYSGFIKGIHFDLAQYYQALGRIPLTLQNYREAIEIDPNDGIVYNNIATVYLSMGQIEQAFEYLRQSVILTPDNALAWNNLAICYIDRGELDKAEQCFRRALAYDPSLISAKDNLERLIHRP